MEQGKELTLHESKGMALKEFENEYVARIEMIPEVKKYFKFAVRKNSIELRLEKKEEKNLKDEKKGFFFFAKCEQGLANKLYFDNEVDVGNVKSDYKDNVLTIIMPKKGQNGN